MVNKIILVGRLGRDPEMFDAGGSRKANFTVATDETYKDRSGEKQKRTEWHRVIAWGKLAEVCENYVHKGDLVFIEGRIQTRQFESQKDGATHTMTEIVANELRILSTIGDGAPKTKKAKQEVSDEDLPF